MGRRVNELKYWYESCIGTIYTTEEMLTFEEMACHVCGDSDYYIGMYATKEEAIKALNNWDEED